MLTDEGDDLMYGGSGTCGGVRGRSAGRTSTPGSSVLITGPVFASSRIRLYGNSLVFEDLSDADDPENFGIFIGVAGRWGIPRPGRAGLCSGGTADSVELK